MVQEPVFLTQYTREPRGSQEMNHSHGITLSVSEIRFPQQLWKQELDCSQLPAGL
jgi:hypothetical protein